MLQFSSGALMGGPRGVLLMGRRLPMHYICAFNTYELTLALFDVSNIQLLATFFLLKLIPFSF